MKPTFQISQAARRSEPRSVEFSSRRLSAIEQSFQSSPPVMRGGPLGFNNPDGSKVRPHFWTLSQGFLAAEAKREYRFEAALFGIMVALAAWPIGLALQAAAHLAK